MSRSWIHRSTLGVARKLFFASAVVLALIGTGGVAQACGGVGEPPCTDLDTPEISVGVVAGALTLLAGGALLLRSRLRPE